MGADVLLQHAAESRPQVMKSPVKREDAVTQRMAAKWTYLQKRILIVKSVTGKRLLWSPVLLVVSGLETTVKICRSQNHISLAFGML